MKFDKARVIGVGSYLPEKVLTNVDLEKMVDTTAEWIFTRTGIGERRVSAEGERTSDLGFFAAERAIHNSGLDKEEIELIIVATMSGDYISPSTAAIIGAKLGIEGTPAFDIAAACSGGIYALSIAKAYIEAGIYKKILLVMPEKMSSIIDYQDRSTCILFGDGAGAMVVSDSGEGYSIEGLSLGADGKQEELLYIPAGGTAKPASEDTLNNREHFLKMNGREIFKHAVRRMGSSIQKSLEIAGLTEADISWFIPHQANMRIIDGLAKRFNVPSERVYKTVHKYGNTSASSTIIAFDELVRKYQLADGSNVVMTAFGAGLTWGAVVLRKIGA